MAELASDFMADDGEFEMAAAGVHSRGASAPVMPVSTATVADAAARLLDLKGLVRLPEFDGQEKSWEPFKFRLMSCLSVLELDQFLVLAGRLTEPLQAALLDDSGRARGRLLYTILTQCCSGKALSMLKLVDMGNGFEAWRRLTQEYEPNEPARHVTVLTGLLAPSWSERGSFVEALAEWEKRVAEYQANSGETLTEGVKCAVVARWAPVKYREHFKLLPADVMSSYDRLRDAVRQYEIRGRMYDSLGHRQGAGHPGAGHPGGGLPAEMDLSFVAWPSGRRSPKGQGKVQLGSPSQQWLQAAWMDKGKGKGKGKQAQGCFICGGQHFARDCRVQVKPVKGKGKDGGKPQQWSS